MNILSTESNKDCLSPLHVSLSTIVSYIACNVAMCFLHVPPLSYIIVFVIYVISYFMLMKINGHSFKE